MLIFLFGVLSYFSNFSDNVHFLNLPLCVSNPYIKILLFLDSVKAYLSCYEFTTCFLNDCKIFVPLSF